MILKFISHSRDTVMNVTNSRRPTTTSNNLPGATAGNNACTTTGLFLPMLVAAKKDREEGKEEAV